MQRAVKSHALLVLGPERQADVAQKLQLWINLAALHQLEVGQLLNQFGYVLPSQFAAPTPEQLFAGFAAISNHAAFIQNQSNLFVFISGYAFHTDSFLRRAHDRLLHSLCDFDLSGLLKLPRVYDAGRLKYSEPEVEYRELLISICT
jgi:hypothetical protein